MTETWSLENFSNILDTQGWHKSMEYKNSCVPSSLYKYSSLFDNTVCNYQTRNKEKLDNLREKQLWVSNYKYLNDPFELKTLYLDRERIIKYGWDVKLLEKLLEFTRSSIQIGCFCNYAASNMPLWAHYANNHKGYCVKYKLLDKFAIYPVNYANKRGADSVISTKVFRELMNGNNKDEKELNKYLSYLFISFSTKFTHWEYEGEFRFFNIENGVEKGTSISLSKANMDVEKIYMGFCCEHKEELMKIGKDIRCEVYEMVFDEYSEEFTFKEKRVV